MTFILTKELPQNFNQYLKTLVQNQTYYFGKYINEFLPLFNSRNYTLLLQSPFIECFQNFSLEKNPSVFIISYRDKYNTRRQITLLECLEINNTDNFESMIKDLIQSWKRQQIQEIILDIPLPPSLFLDKILCPLSFKCIPRIIMVKEVSESKSLEVKHNPIFPISFEDISPALDCLLSAYQNTPWKSLHPEVRNDYEGYEIIKNLINIQQDTEFPTCIQNKLNNQCVGILLGNLIGVQSACLIHLAVHPSYRRQGIATLLLQHWSNLIREKGIKNIFLWTHLSNPALKLYLKEQFQPLHIYPAFYCNLRKEMP